MIPATLGGGAAADATVADAANAATMVPPRNDAPTAIGLPQGQFPTSAGPVPDAATVIDPKKE